LARLTLDQDIAALADFNDLIRLNPRVAAYFDNRRAAYMKLKRPSEALSDANAAVVLAPKHAFVYHSRAGVLRATGDLNGALQDYSTAIGLAPERPEHAFRWNDRGSVHYELGNFGPAIADFSKTLSFDPNFGFARKFRAMALVKIGDVERGRAELQYFLQKEPGDDEARVFLSRLDGGNAVQQAISLPKLEPSSVQRRVALVIGNAAYKHASSLQNPERDAVAIAAALRMNGFASVRLETNLSRDRTIAVLREFARAADTADWAVVYYSGHGLERQGINYMVPVDAELKFDRDIGLEAIDLDKVMNAVEGARKLKLVILDACRDNPFVSRMKSTSGSVRSVGRGLAQVEPDAGTLIVYAAKHGQVAMDGDGANSPLVSALLPRLQTPNIEIRRLFDLVRDDVIAATGGKQQPFTYGSLSGSVDFFFKN